MAEVTASFRVTHWTDRLKRCRRGAVSVLFAAGAIPMIGLIGLAVDFGIWNQTNAQLSVAANVAALTAVRIAANAQVVNDSNAGAEGTVAGQQWFASEAGLPYQGVPGPGKVGTEGVTLNGGTFGANVTVTTGTTVTAIVAYSGTLPSVFGRIFKVFQYNVTGEATAVVTTAPYLNVVMMLDNSASMQIGATNQDIETMQTITPCNHVPVWPNLDSPGALYPGGPGSGLANQNYGAFQISGYDGTIVPPVVATPNPPPMSYPFFTQGASPGSCSPYGGVQVGSGGTTYPNPGAPCAFACHFDNSVPAGEGNDYYGLARSTINSPLYPTVTLRFDLVKQATNNVVNAMQMDNISDINNLQVGIYTFSTLTTRVYPDQSCGGGPTCEAGDSWATAQSDIGGPASYANGPDTGIQPTFTASNANTGDTNFHQDLVQLQSMLTPSSTGVDAAHPRKVLFIVTDGMSDTTGARVISPVSPADCQLFSGPPFNYTVYVVYTPYYPLMNNFYITQMKSYTEPLVGSQVYNAMQACASTPQDFISASDGPTLNAALQTFLKQALNSPARFTQ